MVIIGGSSGIGLACAVRAAEAGADVTVAGRDAAKLTDAQRAIGEGVRVAALDIADENAVRRLFVGLERVDHVVVLAGEPISAPLVASDMTLQRRIMDVRFWGALYVCKYAAPKLPAEGSITLCSGVAVLRPQRGRPVGVASAAAVEGLVRALALEFAPIRVNAISPGPTRTGVFDRYFNERAEEVVASLAERLPVRRIGEPADVAEAILFLMSNSYVTGITLHVDGGYPLI